ncbi:hypothetical protein BH11PSE12_BH11PSE12_19550 [soil metagenome]
MLPDVATNIATNIATNVATNVANNANVGMLPTLTAPCINLLRGNALCIK